MQLIEKKVSELLKIASRFPNYRNNLGTNEEIEEFGQRLLVSQSTPIRLGVLQDGTRAVINGYRRIAAAIAVGKETLICTEEGVLEEDLALIQMNANNDMAADTILSKAKVIKLLAEKMPLIEVIKEITFPQGINTKEARINYAKRLLAIANANPIVHSLMEKGLLREDLKSSQASLIANLSEDILLEFQKDITVQTSDKQINDWIARRISEVPMNIINREFEGVADVISASCLSCEKFSADTNRCAASACLDLKKALLQAELNHAIAAFSDEFLIPIYSEKEEAKSNHKGFNSWDGYDGFEQIITLEGMEQLRSTWESIAFILNDDGRRNIACYKLRSKEAKSIKERNNMIETRIVNKDAKRVTEELLQAMLGKEEELINEKFFIFAPLVSFYQTISKDDLRKAMEIFPSYSQVWEYLLFHKNNNTWFGRDNMDECYQIFIGLCEDNITMFYSLLTGMKYCMIIAASPQKKEREAFFTTFLEEEEYSAIIQSNTEQTIQEKKQALIDKITAENEKIQAKNDKIAEFVERFGHLNNSSPGVLAKALKESSIDLATIKSFKPLNLTKGLKTAGLKDDSLIYSLHNLDTLSFVAKTIIEELVPKPLIPLEETNSDYVPDFDDDDYDYDGYPEDEEGGDDE